MLAVYGEIAEEKAIELMREQQRIAYVAIYKNRVVARSGMLFYDEKYHQANISVDTEEEHRQKGLAACLAAHVISEVRQRDEDPVWDCSEDNKASERTALRLGFKQVRSDVVAWF